MTATLEQAAAVQMDLSVVDSIDGYLMAGQPEFLYAHVAKLRGGRVLEVGSHQGKSTVAMALAALENGTTIDAVDTWAGGDGIPDADWFSIFEASDLAHLKRATALLMEHFETVQIFTTRHTPDGTVNVAWGDGNWYARRGQIGDWLVKQDQHAANMASAEDNDADD